MFKPTPADAALAARREVKRKHEAGLSDGSMPHRQPYIGGRVVTDAMVTDDGPWFGKQF